MGLCKLCLSRRNFVFVEEIEEDVQLFTRYFDVSCSRNQSNLYHWKVSRLGKKYIKNAGKRNAQSSR